MSGPSASALCRVFVPWNVFSNNGKHNLETCHFAHRKRALPNPCHHCLASALQQPSSTSCLSDSSSAERLVSTLYHSAQQHLTKTARGDTPNSHLTTARTAPRTSLSSVTDKLAPFTTPHDPEPPAHTHTQFHNSSCLLTISSYTSLPVTNTGLKANMAGTRNYDFLVRQQLAALAPLNVASLPGAMTCIYFASSL